MRPSKTASGNVSDSRLMTRRPRCTAQNRRFAPPSWRQRGTIAHRGRRVLTLLVGWLAVCAAGWLGGPPPAAYAASDAGTGVVAEPSIPAGQVPVAVPDVPAVSEPNPDTGSGETEEFDGPPPLPVGAQAPTLELENMDGKRQRFPTPGRWTLVFFWSLFCHSCLEEMPQIQEELARLDPAPCDSVFITLDTVKMKTGVKNYMDKRGFTRPVLFEEVASDSFVAADAYGVTITPATLLLDDTGKVVFSRVGPFELEE